MYGIMWNNKDLTVFLVDIPGTIASAQVLKLQRNSSHLISSEPLTTQYANLPEPKTDTARATLQARIGPMMKSSYEEIIPCATDALNQIKAVFQHKVWCEDRFYVPQSLREQLDRQEREDPDGDRGRTIPAKLMRFLTQDYPHAREVECQDPDDEMPCFPAGFSRFFHNFRDDTLKLSYVPDNEAANGQRELGRTTAYGRRVPEYQKAQHFRIPPAASFLLAKCEDGHLFKNAVHHMRTEYDHPKQFDLIIMDPPWPNASAQNNRFYSTFRYVNDMNTMFDKMDLDARIAPGGFIGVWITNSEKVRRYVLGPDGLFAIWGVALVEEWAWVKTTVDGTPVVPLETLFRKPWECFLLGQAPETLGVHWPPVGDWPVKRRILAGVPDLHSRKPCLKPVIEKIWGKAEGQYTALEIFGRACVAGWWTWGNEAIKFNWDRYWVADGEDSEQVKKWDGKEYLSQLSLVASREDRGEEKPAASERAGLKRKASSLE